MRDLACPTTNFLVRIHPVTYRHEKAARSQPTQSTGPIESFNTRFSFIVQSDTQKGNEDEIESLGTEAVHETKILAKGPVNGWKGLPPT